MHAKTKSDLLTLAVVLATSALVAAIVFFAYGVTNDEAQKETQQAETNYLMYVSGFGGNVIGRRDEILQAGYKICDTDSEQVKNRSLVIDSGMLKDPLWQAEAVAAYAYLCPKTS